MSAGRYRRACCRALGRLGDVAAVGPLLDELTDVHATVRAAALRALQEILVDRLGPTLEAELKDGARERRRAVAYAIGELRLESAAASVRWLAEDDSAAVRLSVLHVLDQLDDPAAGDVATQMLADLDPSVRQVTRTLLDRAGATT